MNEQEYIAAEKALHGVETAMTYASDTIGRIEDIAEGKPEFESQIGTAKALAEDALCALRNARKLAISHVAFLEE